MKITWIDPPSFEDMLDLAQKNNILVGTGNRWELFKKLVDNNVEHPKLKDIRVYRRSMSDEEKTDAKEHGKLIPGNTYFHKNIEKKVLSLIAENGLAFESYIFHCRDNSTQYAFDTDSVQCCCGNKIEFKRRYTTDQGFQREEDTDIVVCKECKKQWIKVKTS